MMALKRINLRRLGWWQVEKIRKEKSKMSEEKILDFLEAQSEVFQVVLSELKAGKKSSHWMWFVFPQIQGLGSSPFSIKFSLNSLKEAESYLEHPVLGDRLRTCCSILLSLPMDLSARDIFGYLDDQKLRSSMTLFAQIPKCDPIFSKVLARFFNNEFDSKTLEILNNQN